MNSGSFSFTGVRNYAGTGKNYRCRVDKLFDAYFFPYFHKLGNTITIRINRIMARYLSI